MRTLRKRPMRRPTSPSQTDRSAELGPVSAAQQRLAATEALARVGSWEWDLAEPRPHWSDELCRIFGVPPGTRPTFDELIEMIHPDDRHELTSEVGATRGPGHDTECFYRILRTDGQVRHVHGRRSALRDDAGRVVSLFGTVQDVTEHHATRVALRAIEASQARAERRFRSAFEQSPIGIALVGLDGRFMRVNAALVELLGYDSAELESMRFADITHPDDVEVNLEGMEALIAGRIAVYRAEKRYRHADGHYVWVAVSSAIVRDDAGRPDHHLTQVLDISERKRLEERLQHMADHDPLTGLVNRRRFEAELSEHVARCLRYGAEGALMIVDIDQLKAVNDSFGHRAGDELIVQTARVMESMLRSSDIIARLGGDEFAILLPRATREEADAVAGKLALAGRAHTVAAGEGACLAARFSVGVAMLSEQRVLSLEAWLVAADLAMYEAKSTVPGKPQAVERAVEPSDARSGDLATDRVSG